MTQDFYQKSIEQVVQMCKTDLNKGLTDDVVREKLKREGAYPACHACARHAVPLQAYITDSRTVVDCCRAVGRCAGAERILQAIYPQPRIISGNGTGQRLKREYGTGC